MSPVNFKDFLTSGAFLQIAPDQFKLLMGPFQPAEAADFESSKTNTFLYTANFWDFAKKSEINGQKSVYKVSRTEVLSREDFIGQLNTYSKTQPELNWLSVQESGFRNQFEQSFEFFKKGVLKKTVPIILQESKTSLSFENKIFILDELMKNRNFGWSYGFFNNASGMIGHTPESLIFWSKKNQQGETMALAGTLPKTETAKLEIEQDAKIRTEHNYVVDDISEKLHGFNFERSATSAVELKHLVHLKTDFKIEVSHLEQALQIIKNLHPTSAMGIFPFNQEALHAFSQHELQTTRGLFASPFGFFTQDEMQIVVAIRNILFSGDKISIFSGCGITNESQYDLELAELENK
ncbi:MAG: chorismate-binding protein, partial [Pseudobdellovibrio sp.]